MPRDNFEKLLDLIKQYQYFLWAGALIFALCLAASLWIFYEFDGSAKEEYWFKLAEFLMDVSQTILGTVLIGGGLGGVVNFIFEEQKKEEEEVQNRLKRMQDRRDRRREIQRDISKELRQIHDEVALSRILIKSHRSGLTYGEQLRTKIMPSNIALQELKRQLGEIQEDKLVSNIPELQVSLTYMSAYLSVLIEEFSCYYLQISNLQNFQDSIAERRREVFTETLEEAKDRALSKEIFLGQTDELLKEQEVPNRLDLVWEAMEELDYIWDFIDDLRDKNGKASMYQMHFLDHHFHALRILQYREEGINQKLVQRKDFQENLVILEELATKKKGDQPITKEDSLARKIMEKSLDFDLDEMRKRVEEEK